MVRAARFACFASLLALSALASSGCAAASHAAAPASLVAELPLAPAPLDRSYFAPRGSSGLAEEDLGRILDAPVQVKPGSRVGVAAVGMAFQPVAPGTVDAGVQAARALSTALEETGGIAVASEVSPELPTGGGLEGLRELAARYRAPYLVLYSERFEDRSHGNGLSVLWVTLVGGLLTPSRTLRAQGVLEASVLDVRTGTILFTVQEPVSFESWHLPLGAEDAYRDLARETADEGVKKLATRVVEKWQRLVRASVASSAPVASL